jgi:chromosomal replication initiation ATPase DnaA
VAAFLLRRLPRGTHALVAAVMRLDAASLRDRRALTIPFAREVLELDPGAADDTPD